MDFLLKLAAIGIAFVIVVFFVVMPLWNQIAPELQAISTALGGI